MYMRSVGLGTKLRKLLALLDGDVQQLYIESASQFRPKYFPVVSMLLSEAEQDVLTLAAAAQVTQPAMTQTLQEMEQAGLIVLRPGEDRRQRLVSLTRFGKAEAERLVPLWEAVSRAAVALDRELSASLSGTVEEALMALERKSFRSRIREEMK
jgi:MarR family transcriptional regulator, organic hydroperoxide resistance regulator